MKHLKILFLIICVSYLSINAAQIYSSCDLYNDIILFASNQENHTRCALFDKYESLLKKYGHLSIDDWITAFETKHVNYEQPLLTYIYSDGWRGVPVFFKTLYTVLVVARDVLIIPDMQYKYFIAYHQLYKCRKPQFSEFLNTCDAYSKAIIFGP